MEQRLIHLERRDGKYYNFFNTSGSIASLDSFLKKGWVVLEMNVDHDKQSGWVLLTRTSLDKELKT
jgi:uncharacterized protein YjhX (UPF0386 family)